MEVCFAIVSWGYVGIMEKKMETTIVVSMFFSIIPTL